MTLRQTYVDDPAIGMAQAKCNFLQSHGRVCLYNAPVHEESLQHDTYSSSVLTDDIIQQAFMIRPREQHASLGERGTATPSSASTCLTRKFQRNSSIRWRFRNNQTSLRPDPRALAAMLYFFFLTCSCSLEMCPAPIFIDCSNDTLDSGGFVKAIITITLGIMQPCRPKTNSR